MRTSAGFVSELALHRFEKRAKVEVAFHCMSCLTCSSNFWTHGAPSTSDQQSPGQFDVRASLVSTFVLCVRILPPDSF